MTTTVSGATLGNLGNSDQILGEPSPSVLQITLLNLFEGLSTPSLTHLIGSHTWRPLRCGKAETPPPPPLLKAHQGGAKGKGYQSDHNAELALALEHSACIKGGIKRLTVAIHATEQFSI